MASNIITSDDLIEKIIKEEPKHEREIQLEFINNISTKELFSFCMEFFHTLSKYKYSEPNGTVDISKWSLNTISYIKEYYNSFGLDINITILEPTQNNRNLIQFYQSRSFSKYPFTHNTKLKDVYYTLYHNNTNKYYIINFDYLN